MLRLARAWRAISLVLLATVVLFASPRASALESTYMVVFGSQRTFDPPKSSHTFGTFVRVVWSVAPDGMSLVPQIANVHTISWLAQDEIVRIFRKSVPGKNMTLAESLDLAWRFGAKVRRWGPVEIQPELYARSVVQFDRLQRAMFDSSIQYSVSDGRQRLLTASGLPGGAVDCIHALSDVGGFLRTGTEHGFGASRDVFNHMRPFMINPDVDVEWIAAALGVQGVELGGHGLQNGFLNGLQR